MTSPIIDWTGYADIPPGKIASVVTFLEMTSQPPHRATTTRDDLALARMNKPDLDWYRGLFRDVGQDYLWFSRLVMSDDDLRRTIHDPRVEIYRLKHNDADAGFIELDGRIDGEIELAFFGVRPALIGKGLGRFMMQAGLDRVWSRPITRFWVHTCTLDHPDALRFYIASGFKPYRRMIEVVDDPRRIGVLPRNAAPAIPIL